MDRLIERMEYLRDFINEKECTETDIAVMQYYRGQLSGMKNAFLILFSNNTDMCEYVLEI